MNAYFQSISQPMPQITDVSVDGTQNNPNQYIGDPHDPDVEVAMDIQIAAAAYYVATGRPAVIRVYWAANANSGAIAAAIRAATADNCDVCSISWGSDEANWQSASQADGTDYIADVEAAATAATAAGMIVFAASGDNDSSDGGQTPANVDVPSSCPHVIGCGGTTKAMSSEVVWNNDPSKTDGEGTGGGYSTVFPAQSWQAGAPSGKGRMVPDVSADADPNTGYTIFVHGQSIVEGGTSAVAPLYSGLFAALGTKLGFVSPKLWANQLCFNDITQGNNGFYRATQGPDPCSGLGSPIGTKIAALFGFSTAVQATQKTARDLVAQPNLPQTSTQIPQPWRWAALTILFVGLLIACGTWISLSAKSSAVEYIQTQWLCVEAVMLGLCIVAGYAVNNRADGILIDETNRVSLARAQWVAWFIILLGGFFTESIWNIVAGFAPSVTSVTGSGAQAVTTVLHGAAFPFMQPDLYALLGIVTGSAITSSLIVDNKKAAPNAPPPPVNPQIGQPTQQGLMDANVSPTEASWADLYLGEEVANRNTVDISRLQKLVITILLVMTYVQMLWGDLGTKLAGGAKGFNEMPQVDSSFLWLLGISHAAYLAYKATPKTPTAQSAS
jgi:kumamolisin